MVENLFSDFCGCLYHSAELRDIIFQISSRKIKEFARSAVRTEKLAQLDCSKSGEH